MVLGLEGDVLPVTESNGAGFTLIGYILDTRGVDQDQATAEDDVVSTTQSSISVAFSANQTNSREAIGDAIQAATLNTPNPFQQKVTWNPSTYQG